MKSEQTPIRTRLSRIEGKRTTQATSLQLGFSGTLRFNITAEESLWDQRFCMIFRGECERDLSGGRGRCKGLSSWATNGPAKWLFRCSGVRMSGCSSTSKITPWRWLFMIYYDLYTMSSFLILFESEMDDLWLLLRKAKKKIGQKWTKVCEAHVPIIMSKVVYFAV